jgi:hypothetical protein
MSFHHSAAFFTTVSGDSIVGLATAARSRHAAFEDRVDEHDIWAACGTQMIGFHGDFNLDAFVSEGARSHGVKMWSCCKCDEGGMTTYVEQCPECSHERCPWCTTYSGKGKGKGKWEGKGKGEGEGKW